MYEKLTEIPFFLKSSQKVPKKKQGPQEYSEIPFIHNVFSNTLTYFVVSRY